MIFDVTRRSDGGTGAENRDGLRGPAWRVHVDYTIKSGPQRVRDILGETEVTRLNACGGRIIQINVWRPIRGPVERAPLAVADASSVRPEELIATDQVFPDLVGEIYHLAHAPSQRWYYSVRRHINWNNHRPDLKEDLAHLVQDIKPTFPRWPSNLLR